MSLAPGVRLGVYEVLALVGSGGMGEVYRAHDARLGRDVAIKVLPPAFADDAERLRRFEQEARAAAALNHPNILAVHDLGTHDGCPYIVSELLDGETLLERLTTAMPARKAIEIAIQIARGLAAAHDKGIVHRDLKPANIFLTADGRVKILDFGLAKLTAREPTGAAPGSGFPTRVPDTLPGVVLGTIGYMAPEQVRGLEADHRADIFAFGAILYEMLAGRRAFRGDTAVDTMTAILKEEPEDLPAADRRIPPALTRIVDRCLEKSPAARFRSADDLAFALEALSAHSGAAEAIAGAPAGKPRDRRLRALVVVLALLWIATAAAAAFVYFGRFAPEVRAIRFVISPPDGWNLTQASGAGVSAGALALSPDGSRLAFVAQRGDGRPLIWLRPLDSLTAQPLNGTEGAMSPFWSPDSRFLGFFAGGKLKKIDIAGGPPLELCSASDVSSGAWSRDGVIVFVPGTNTSLQRVPAAGGTPSAATKQEPGDGSHARPIFLPDGRHFLYRTIGGTPTTSVAGNADRSGGETGAGPVFLASLDSADRTLLLESGSTNVQYSQGHVLFARGTTLMAQRFDLDRLALSGEAVPIAEQIQRLAPFGYGVFSASDTGVLAYQTGIAVASAPQLAWIDRTGKQIATVGERSGHTDVALSPDARQASVRILDFTRGTGDMWLIDLARGLPTRFTIDPADEGAAVWSPDGGRLVFSALRGGAYNLFQKNANGTGAEDPLLADAVNKQPLAWSPDGRVMLYGAAGGAESGNDLWALPMSGDGKPYVFLKTPFNEGQARFSPDGRWVAFTSNESGRNEVYVTPFPGPGGKYRVSSNGGVQPRWRGDGKEIFYVMPPPEGGLMAATVVNRGAALEVSTITRLFPIVPVGQRSFYDVTPDGQRFLVSTMTVAERPPPASPVTVVVNWTAGLKK